MSTSDLRELLTTRWKAREAGPFFEVAPPPDPFLEAFPPDYLAAVSEFGGREGFLGDTYLRLYRLDELVALNVAYQVPELLPEIILFGSNGTGNAFAFPLWKEGVVQVPFVPLSKGVGKQCSSTFREFVEQLADSGEPAEPGPHVIGMEVHDIPPIDGDKESAGTESSGPVPPAKHAEICRYWNKVYRDHEAAVKREEEKSGGS